jgi:hypothetical protein
MREITVTINDDDIKRQLNLFIGDDRMSAEIALRYLLDEFDFDLEELLKASSMGMSILVLKSEWRFDSFQKKA